MKIRQAKFSSTSWDAISETPGFLPEKASLVLAFGERKLLEKTDPHEYLKEQYPNAQIIINSTSGEIIGEKVYDDTIVVTAIEFEKTTVRTVQFDISNHKESYAVGEKLARALDEETLLAIILISDGGVVNGSELIEASNRWLSHPVPVIGGLAGDAGRFERTLVGANQNPVSGKVVGIGLYGTDLKIGHGTMGGWDVFGPEREVTKSVYNELYQIDDRDALDLYKDYLGRYAEGLPGTALLFPLSIRISPDSQPLVRTILSINETTKSMTFAGDIPEGACVRFMRANLDRLVEASALAAQNALTQLGKTPELAILISCVGRKLVLGQRTEEEVEVASDIFGNQLYMTGFYSYGEIAPAGPASPGELHNQTMTITILSEQ
ncbi:histidine kinase [Spirosoma sp. KCTC 42546]|uniref:FIST signal transduction protein n=1 Tax=Spirosoma sp. KCTC 42546 TaxID=2520506 RepID=UPI00115BDD62|nr:FIST N-terminal domain-containing protein [Spirosoma sp. KCTC 42546]QDK79719.1 histidine kinase [Spirosoma sp. KCTC 42546]